MNKKIIWSVIIMISISANPALAITLTEYLMVSKDKVSAEQALIAGNSTDKNDTIDEKIKRKDTTSLAMVLTQPANSYKPNNTLSLEVSELTDNSGLVYLGGKVSADELRDYLVQLKSVLGEEQYIIYRQYQSVRDKQSFHVTLITPDEYQTINKDNLKLSSHFKVTLQGLGRVEKKEKNSYFVVASSTDGELIRQKLFLTDKDFHITLGFYPDDVYGVGKGRDTLIKQ